MKAIINAPKTWQDAKDNSDILTGAIENILNNNPPKNIADILAAVKKIDKKCGAIPNPNYKGQYCQLILYPSPKWQTWSTTSMSITKYNIYR